MLGSISQHGTAKFPGAVPSRHSRHWIQNRYLCSGPQEEPSPLSMLRGAGAVLDPDGWTVRHFKIIPKIENTR